MPYTYNNCLILNMCFIISERFLDLFLPPALRPRRLAYRHHNGRATMLVYKSVRNVGNMTVPVGTDPSEWNDQCELEEGGYSCLCCPIRTLVRTEYQGDTNRPLTPTQFRDSTT